MPYSYYIYYRVEPGRDDAAALRIWQLLARVRETTGIAGRLMTKRGEPNLWMEIYENVADDAKFERELAEAVRNLKVTEIMLAGSGRHIECFSD